MERLLAPAYPDDAAKFDGGALGIFRLAPQDYHRFHVPVDGVLGEPKLIEGQYYTVNPMAIRSTYESLGCELIPGWMCTGKIFGLLCRLILSNSGG